MCFDVVSPQRCNWSRRLSPLLSLEVWKMIDFTTQPDHSIIHISPRWRPVRNRQTSINSYKSLGPKSCKGFTTSVHLYWCSTRFCTHDVTLSIWHKLSCAWAASNKYFDYVDTTLSCYCCRIVWLGRLWRGATAFWMAHNALWYGGVPKVKKPRGGVKWKRVKV